MTDFLVAPWQSPQDVTSILVTAPVEEPLTLEEGKLRAGLDWPPGDPRDQLMNGFIAAARQKVEKDTGLALLKQTRAITLTYHQAKPIPLPMHALPLLSITDPAGVAISKAQYSVDAVRRTIQFWSLSWTDATDAAWVIESGWPDRATLAKEAPLLVQAVGLLTAHLATFGRDLVNVDEGFETPAGYADAIAPFCQVWVI